MRILLLNQDWFKTELQELGHEVVTCGFQHHLDVVVTHSLLHIDSVKRLLPNSFEPEVIVWLDNSAPVLFTGLEECETPVIFYSVDTHHHAELHGLIGHMFDKTFVAQKDFIPEVEQNGLKVEWMPLWASRWVDPSTEKKWDSTFVGNLNHTLNPDRVRFFEDLKTKIDIHITTGRYWEIFPFAEIVVNQTVKSDLNFRVFEAMMCGATLLTEKAGNGLNDLFKDGEHIVTYEKNNSDDAASKIRSLLSDRAKCRQIAESGRNEILARHLPKHRAATFDQAIRTVKRANNPWRFLGAMCNYSALSISIERNGGNNPAPALIAALKNATHAFNIGEKPGSHHLFYLITAALRYDRMAGTGGGRELLNNYAEAHPENSLLQYMKIRNLLNSGKRDEAIAFARLIYSEPPEVIFAKAEECAQNMLAAAAGT